MEPSQRPRLGAPVAAAPINPRRSRRSRALAWAVLGLIALLALIPQGGDPSVEPVSSVQPSTATLLFAGEGLAAYQEVDVVVTADRPGTLRLVPSDLAIDSDGRRVERTFGWSERSLKGSLRFSPRTFDYDPRTGRRDFTFTVVVDPAGIDRLRTGELQLLLTDASGAVIDRASVEVVASPPGTTSDPMSAAAAGDAATLEAVRLRQGSVASLIERVLPQPSFLVGGGPQRAVATVATDAWIPDVHVAFTLDNLLGSRAPFLGGTRVALEQDADIGYLLPGERREVGLPTVGTFGGTEPIEALPFIGAVRVTARAYALVGGQQVEVGRGSRTVVVFPWTETLFLLALWGGSRRLRRLRADRELARIRTEGFLVFDGLGGGRRRGGRRLAPVVEPAEEGAPDLDGGGPDEGEAEGEAGAPGPFAPAATAAAAATAALAAAAAAAAETTSRVVRGARASSSVRARSILWTAWVWTVAIVFAGLRLGRRALAAVAALIVRLAAAGLRAARRAAAIARATLARAGSRLAAATPIIRAALVRAGSSVLAALLRAVRGLARGLILVVATIGQRFRAIAVATGSWVARVAPIAGRALRRGAVAAARAAQSVAIVAWAGSVAAMRASARWTRTGSVVAGRAIRSGSVVAGRAILAALRVAGRSVRSGSIVAGRAILAALRVAGRSVARLARAYGPVLGRATSSALRVAGIVIARAAVVTWRGLRIAASALGLAAAAASSAVFLGTVALIRATPRGLVALRRGARRLVVATAVRLGNLARGLGRALVAAVRGASVGARVIGFGLQLAAIGLVAAARWAFAHLRVLAATTTVTARRLLRNLRRFGREAVWALRSVSGATMALARLAGEGFDLGARRSLRAVGDTVDRRGPELRRWLGARGRVLRRTAPGPPPGPSDASRARSSGGRGPSRSPRRWWSSAARGAPSRICSVAPGPRSCAGSRPADGSCAGSRSRSPPLPHPRPRWRSCGSPLARPTCSGQRSA